MGLMWVNDSPMLNSLRLLAFERWDGTALGRAGEAIKNGTDKLAEALSPTRIIYGIIEKYGLANLLISTMMAGVLLFAMGFFRLGNLVKFIPVSIVIGFTNGIAVLIALSQRSMRVLQKPSVVAVLDRITGLVFLGFGVKLAVSQTGL